MPFKYFSIPFSETVFDFVELENQPKKLTETRLHLENVLATTLPPSSSGRGFQSAYRGTYSRRFFSFSFFFYILFVCLLACNSIYFRCPSRCVNGIIPNASPSSKFSFRGLDDRENYFSSDVFSNPVSACCALHLGRYLRRQ